MMRRDSYYPSPRLSSPERERKLLEIPPAGRMFLDYIAVRGCDRRENKIYYDDKDQEDERIEEEGGGKRWLKEFPKDMWNHSMCECVSLWCEKYCRRNNWALKGLRMVQIFEVQMFGIPAFNTPPIPIAIWLKKHSSSCKERTPLEEGSFNVELEQGSFDVELEILTGRKRTTVSWTVDNDKCDNFLEQPILDLYLVKYVVFSCAVKVTFDIKLYPLDTTSALDVSGYVIATYRHNGNNYSIPLFQKEDTCGHKLEPGDSLKLRTSILSVPHNLRYLKVNVKIADTLSNFSVEDLVLFDPRLTYISQERCLYGTSGCILLRVTWKPCTSCDGGVCSCPQSDVFTFSDSSKDAFGFCKPGIVEKSHQFQLSDV